MKKVTDILNTQYPLIQAPMSWLTSAKLVAAVSNAGGLGVLGPNAGQTTVTRDPDETAKRMQSEIKKVKRLTTKPFGINILTPKTDRSVAETRFTRELLDVAFIEEIKYFVVVGTAHQELFNLIKEHDGVIIFRPLTPTIDQMRLGEKYGADVAVATGSDEGGVIPEQDFGTFTVVPTMVDSVDIPVLAAGGINDHRGVKAAFALGAQGVYIGSRFLMTDEAPMSDQAKELVKKSSYDNIYRVSPTQRSIKTSIAEKYAKEEYLNPHNNDLDKQINSHGGVRPGMLLGDFNTGIVSINNGVDILNTVVSVKKLVHSLMDY
ncbi:nitronate monooxygenase [Companilactobacillus halodurans]|uniref:Probable nitronate monooxygenase n=1 Tax=Companilactobacillus halodurans TaxID=2584183 RepID=A0A5P0ZZG3_9LACO|nr:nitronate monooxygenase [Companilactobacillus halodurans]MQS76779.1 2-nitropropane dioxygenase [Companilactobacillus halodurans]MQS98449.1 2-nitropropane dioxygenase [Companilactobacillus halodurans]